MAHRAPAPIGVAYGASKAGLEILTRYWATEFGGSGVRVNTVSPSSYINGAILFADGGEISTLPS